MGLLLNRAKENTATTGTGAVTPSGAVVPYQTFSAAGAVSGNYYDYLIEDGVAWEIGTGLYNGTTITRPGPGVDPNFASSSGALISLSGSATVSCVAAKQGSGLQFIGETVAVGGEVKLAVSGIPAGLRDLMVSFAAQHATLATSQNLIIRVNDDASAIYDLARVFGGSSTGGDQTLNGTGWATFVALSNAAMNTGEMTFERYTAAREKKVIAHCYQSTSNHSISSCGRWRNNAAITKVSIEPTTVGGGFAAGSSITVYGRA